MEHTPEQQRKAHERGAAVLAKLAMSFGVTVSNEEEERWVTLLTVMREVDEAALNNSFYAGPCQKALLEGVAQDDVISKDTVINFKKLYEGSNTDEQLRLVRIVHDLAYHDAGIQKHHLEHLDIINDAIDHEEKIKAFQDTLNDDALYRASLFMLRPSTDDDRNTEADIASENVSRFRFNRWLTDFFIAYEQIGAFLHSNRDVKKGRHSVESVGSQSFSQARVAVRSLARCIYHGAPRTPMVLLTTGVARAGRKLTRRL